VIFRQFRADDGQLSYLFADPVTRHAAVVDPHLSLEQDYFDMMRHLDLRLVLALETHAHESHLSAGPLLCEETGARWVLSSVAAGAVSASAARDGDCLYVGEECIGALATPGHSACSICLRWRDAVFSGHTLLAGAAGDCCRPDADAAALYDSIRARLYSLPPETRVYPGAEFAGARETTIGRERARNDEVSDTTSAMRFIAVKRADCRAARWALHLADSQRGADLYPYHRVAAS